ncbi:MAG: peptidoglycan editing factor PgeF [Chromatiales bacterium]|nr:peptidoglycan editing factor PgeF [Chromatiales bacterium]
MSDGLIFPDWSVPENVIAGTTTRHATGDLLPDGLAFLNQVHGAVVVTADGVRSSAGAVDADAVVGCAPGEICAVRTADCLPVLFCSADGRNIAAAHAGWRGLAAGVLENTVAAMRCQADDLIAWFGPAISQANFEVGEDVRSAFIDPDPTAADWFTANERGRWQADLYGLARRRLQRCGVAAIYGGGWCTYADEEHFYSYRRAAETGRMVSFVALK